MKLWSIDYKKKKNDINSVGEVSPKIYCFLDLLTVGVGSSIGVGISVLIGGLIKNVTGPAVVASIAVAGLAALAAGLCFAEFAVRFLKVNSAYAYSYVLRSENFTFIFGWALMLQYVACTASAAKAIITFIDALVDYKITEFLRKFVTTNYENVFPYFDFLSLIIPVAVTILYVVGKKDSLLVKKIFITCNAVLIALVIVIGGFKADIKNWEIGETPGEEPKNGFAPFGVIGVVKGAAIGFYGFIGFDEINVSGSEVKNRKKNLPLVILATIFVILLAYAGVGSVLSLMLPYYKLNSHAAVPFAFEEMEWTALKWVTAVATFFGFQTSLFGAMYSLPGTIQSMANDGLLFHCLGNSHSITKIPLAAALTGGLITATAAGIFPFQTLVNVAVMGALFVHTALAISVVLFRYSPKFESEEKLSESCMNLINNEPDVSVKAVMKNYFNFREKQPTNLTKIIIMGNIILFCISSIGVSVIFIYFYDPLISCNYWAVIPAGLLLCVMFFNLISMTCQPKCRENIPFKVPLIPLLPCLSILLNIFLIVTFGLLMWELFSIWMAVGLIPHFTWRLLKYLRGERGQNSLYEINRTNSLKLHESIWKIQKDKKSYYEGAINSVFCDDLEDKFSGNSEIEVKKQNEKLALQLMQAEIIQSAEVVPEEKTEPIDDEPEFNFIRINSEEIVSGMQEDEKVQWECVAEVHTEEVSFQENVALEIVDSTYNFLTEVSEELLKSDDKFKETESTNDPEAAENNDSPEDKYINEKSNNEKNFKETILEKNLSEPLKENSELPEDTKNFADISDEMHINKKICPKVIRVEKAGGEEVSDEQKKVKDFKEKLNQLLKNQVNGDSVLNKNSVNSRPRDAAEEERENNKKELYSGVKTLNKSEIKGKLEFLLSKGPPKRSSLGNSFNIKIKPTDEEKEVEKTTNENPKSHNHEVLKSNDNSEISSSILQNNIKEKILLIKGATKNRTTDACC